VSGLEELVDDEAADGAGGAEGGDFRDKAPASVVVVVVVVADDVARRHQNGSVDAAADDQLGCRSLSEMLPGSMLGARLSPDR
jgi:hypothetical protein